MRTSRAAAPKRVKPHAQVLKPGQLRKPLKDARLRILEIATGSPRRSVHDMTRRVSGLVLCEPMSVRDLGLPMPSHELHREDRCDNG